MNRISLRSEISLIETAVKCTTAFSVHAAAIFEHIHVASISVSFHGHIARLTVRKFLTCTSTAKIGATVTVLTSIVHGCSWVLLGQRNVLKFYTEFLSPESVLTYGENYTVLTLQRGVTGTARMPHALTHSSISRQVREQM